MNWIVWRHSRLLDTTLPSRQFRGASCGARLAAEGARGRGRAAQRDRGRRVRLPQRVRSRARREVLPARAHADQLGRRGPARSL